MSDSVRRLKANKVIAGKRCGWCKEPLTFGEDAAVCGECKLLHHAECWDEKGGCARPGCANAPLQGMEAAPPPIEPGGRGRGRAGASRIRCPHCGRSIGANVLACPFCRGAVGGPQSSRPSRARRYAQHDPSEDPMTGIDWLLAILCSFIGCIVAIVYLCQGKTKKGVLMLIVSIVMQLVWGMVRFLMLKDRMH